MNGGIAHTMALLAAIALMVAVSAIRAKIENPSPPPPEGVPDERGDQGKRTDDSAGPRGDVDHGRPGWESDYIPPEPPDLTQPTRVGWYEDDPETPGRTRIHWVNRGAWEAAQDDGDRRPGWLRALWP